MTFPQLRTLLAAALFASSFALCSGCAEEGPETVAVRGTVKLDGKPLPVGTIVFIPQEGTRGPRAAGEIRDGKYEIAETEGPGVGSLRVDIWGREASDITDIKAPKPAVTVAVPQEFNSQSTLTVETRSGADNTFDFDLKPSRTTTTFKPVLR